MLLLPPLEWASDVRYGFGFFGGQLTVMLQLGEVPFRQLVCLRVPTSQPGPLSVGVPCEAVLRTTIKIALVSSFALPSTTFPAPTAALTISSATISCDGCSWVEILVVG